MSTILALDIGTDFVKAVMAKTSKKGKLEVIGVGRAHQAPDNMIKGAIANIPAVISVCEKALIDAEEEAGETANLTVVGIAGELVKGNTTTVDYHRKDPNKPITEAEMNSIMKTVQDKSSVVAKKAISLEAGNRNVEIRLINSAIISLTIDGYKVNNPIGFKGSEISIQFYTAFAPLIHIAAIEKVCAELNLELLAVAVEPFAVCRACLGDNLESKFSGIVMDIGGGTTDIAVIDEGGIEGTKMFSMGGRSFTKQIAEATGTDFDTAEEYKLNPYNDEFDQHLKDQINSAINRNLSVWLSGVEVALEDFDIKGTLPKSVVLCGGGASLSALQEIMAISDWYKDLPFARRPVIYLLNTADLPDVIYSQKTKLDHSFMTALGLLRVGYDTLITSPEETGIKAKFNKLLQK
ncbi:rod shape-determining protein [Candidatus Saccharibacteria bacterium]|nr:rod shape-determining protein [Candidatus Saccharibacteria bacterium]